MRYTEIQDSLIRVVGWHQNFNQSKSIDERLTQSESGLYFQDAHPLMTLKNIQSIMPDDFNLKYPSWNTAVDYKKGYKVRHNDIIWIAKSDNIAQEPTASDFNDDYSVDYGNSYWQPYNSLSDFVEIQTRAGINQAVQKFITDKQLKHETRTLCENHVIFDGAGRIKDTIKNGGKLVGFEIVPVRSQGITTKIEEIGLQFNANCEITLYLFNSSQIEPVKRFPINYTGNGSYQWFRLDDCFMPYMKNVNAGGAWFLCYNQDDLPDGVNAINYVRDWSREPCGTCNRGNLENWRELTKYIQISPFKIKAPSTFNEYPEMWDISTITYPNTVNFGMNARISVLCDISDIIIEQRQMFANVIQLQVAYNILRTMAMNPDVRVNRNQFNVDRNSILYELDGNSQGRASGLGLELQNAYKALRIDTQGIDRICLACHNGGIRFKSL